MKKLVFVVFTCFVSISFVGFALANFSGNDDSSIMTAPFLSSMTMDDQTRFQSTAVVDKAVAPGSAIARLDVAADIVPGHPSFALSMVVDSYQGIFMVKATATATSPRTVTLLEARLTNQAAEIVPAAIDESLSLANARRNEM